MAKLSAQHPNADTELHFENAYQLLVATILSAQCTDERVNQVTPALFRRYPDARALAGPAPRYNLRSAPPLPAAHSCEMSQNSSTSEQVA